MSEQKVVELDDVTARQLETVRAWLREYGRTSVPVLVGPAPKPEDFEEGEEPYDDREIEFTQGAPFLSGNAGDIGRIAMVRLGWNWRPIELSKIEVHPRFEPKAALKPIQQTELEFPPPQCVYCEIDLYHDGDGWQCEQCRACWSGSYGGDHTRVCVEPECDGAEAQVTGEDGQPRCLSCNFLVFIGQIQPTGPYKCRESYCGDEVRGMPAGAKARAHRRCGRHQGQADSDAYWKDYLASKPVSSTGSP